MPCLESGPVSGAAEMVNAAQSKDQLPPCGRLRRLLLVMAELLLVVLTDGDSDSVGAAGKDGGNVSRSGWLCRTPSCCGCY
jgi:hypothetical protein